MSFHSTIPSLSVYYSESGPDASDFEAFTETLSSRIHDAQNA